MKIEIDTDETPSDGNVAHATSLDDAHRLFGMRVARLIDLSSMDAPPEILLAERKMIATALMDIRDFVKDR